VTQQHADDLDLRLTRRGRPRTAAARIRNREVERRGTALIDDAAAFALSKTLFDPWARIRI
jgi:hypothetical protein